MFALTIIALVVCSLMILGFLIISVFTDDGDEKLLGVAAALSLSFVLVVLSLGLSRIA